MDVGLNNKNTLGTFDSEFSDVVFLVEATSTEQFSLWKEYSKESMTNFEPLSDLDIQIMLDMRLKPKVKRLNDKIKEYASSHRIDWEQVSSGFSLTIGYVKKLPVTINFNFAFINGKKICFYDCTSRMADHVMIEKWLIKHFQLTHDNYCRWNHVNAMNFHNCIKGLDNLDKEPRNTVYRHSTK